METTLITEESKEETSLVSDPHLEEHVEAELPPEKVYPWARHALLITFIILAIVLLAGLIYLNGRSIYQYGV